MKPNSVFKKAVLIAYIEHFQQEHQALIQSARAAHFASTHEESRAEDRHDTFAIEQSYLAFGQAARVRDLESSLVELQSYLESQKQETQPKPGTLIELELSGKQHHALVVHHGGGTKVTVEGKSISLLSLRSPLGEQLIGLKAGDDFTLHTESGEKEYVLVSIE